MTNEQIKTELKKQGITVSLALHGQIFCIPSSLNLYARYFDTLEQAFNHYKPHFKN